MNFGFWLLCVQSNLTLNQFNVRISSNRIFCLVLVGPNRSKIFMSMLLIFYGNLESGANMESKISTLICLDICYGGRAVTNLKFISEKTFYLCVLSRVACKTIQPKVTSKSCVKRYKDRNVQGYTVFKIPKLSHRIHIRPLKRISPDPTVD